MMVCHRCLDQYLDVGTCRTFEFFGTGVPQLEQKLLFYYRKCQAYGCGGDYRNMGRYSRLASNISSVMVRISARLHTAAVSGSLTMA